MLTFDKPNQVTRYLQANGITQKVRVLRQEGGFQVRLPKTELQGVVVMTREEPGMPPVFTSPANEDVAEKLAAIGSVLYGSNAHVSA